MAHSTKLSFPYVVVGMTIAASGFVGCGQNGQLPGGSVDSDVFVGPPELAECTDDDQDGLLAGCRGGTDCDDTDPNVRDECHRCQIPSDGCPCSQEGATTECGSVARHVGPVVSCVTGTRTCAGGAWSACRAEGTKTLHMDSAPGTQTLGLASGPVACSNNPCDPHCTHFDHTVAPDMDGSTEIDSGLTLPPLETSSGGGGPPACGTTNATATRHPLGVVMMVDKSGSMDMNTSGSTAPCHNASTADDGSCPWKNVQSALRSFVQASTTAGMYVGLDFFPASSSCGITSEYVGVNYVTAVGTGTSKFAVDLGVLPGAGSSQQTNLVNAITAVTDPSGGTPMIEGMTGALLEAKAWAMAQGDPDAKAVVALVTDGLPTDCGNCGGSKKSKIKSGKRAASCRVQEVAQLVESYYFGTPQVETFVIGVDSDGSSSGDNLTYLDVIARAGSGGSRDAYIVDGASGTTTSDAIVTALNDIRDEALSCEFDVPTPSGGVIDPTSAQVTLTSGGTPTVLTQRTTMGACTVSGVEQDGFAFNLDGPSIELCPKTCTTAKNDLTATIGTEYSCIESCGSGSSRGEPGPLDMLVMMDRSGSMQSETSGVTRWQAAAMALRNFLRNEESADMGFGISFFPIPTGCRTCGYCDGFLGSCGSGYSNWHKAGWFGPDPDSAPCNRPRTDGSYDSCTGADGYDGATRTSGKYYYGVQSSVSCTASDYVNFGSTGGEAVQILPGTSNAAVDTMFSAILRQIPEGATPTKPALQGAISYMTTASYGPRAGVKKVVVLVTDGEPTACGNASEVAAVATAGYNAGIETFVIGVTDGGSGAPSTANMNSIARAGSGNKYDAFMVNTSNPQAFVEALSTIRRRAMNCTFDVPTPPDGGELDLTNPSVRLTAGTPVTETSVTQVTGSASCGTNVSWYYDDNTSPTSINLCDNACSIVKSDLDARMDILYQCVPEAPTYGEGTLLFEYDSTGACEGDQQAFWGDWSWDATTPSDSKITFEVATGQRASDGTITDLTNYVPIEFTRTVAPDGVTPQDLTAYDTCAGAPGVCVPGVDTQSIGVFALCGGDAVVHETLQNAGLPTTYNYVAIRARLTASTDALSRPSLSTWDLRVTCQDHL